MRNIRWLIVVACVACGDNEEPETNGTLTEFDFLVADNPGLLNDAMGTIEGSTVHVVLPFGTDARALRPHFVAGGPVSVDCIEQSSGANRHDFTKPLVYTVGGEFGTSADYSIDVAAHGFGPMKIYPVDHYPEFILVADLNGDEAPDLLVGHGVSILSMFINGTQQGATSVTFGPRTDLQTGIAFSRSVAAGDLNGDGKLDLVVGQPPNNVIILLNKTATGATTPTFAPVASIPIAVNAAAGIELVDLNVDGRLDVAIVDINQNLAVKLNTTSAGSQTPTFGAETRMIVGYFSQALGIGDFDGDGKPDIAVTSPNLTAVLVFLNTTAAGAATASFAPQRQFATGSNPVAVKAADLNGDDRLDLVTANSVGDSVSVLLGSASAPGSFDNAVEVPAGKGNHPTSVVIADFDGDDRLDLATSNPGGGALESGRYASVFLNATATGASMPAFGARLEVTANPRPYAVASGDFNRDGRPDLAVTSGDYLTLAIHLGK